MNERARAPPLSTMRLVFGLDFDSGSWPGALAGRDACAGEAWLGPAGLLEVLETALGLSAPRAPPVARAAALVPALRQADGFWSESFAVDPLGTARQLLRWHDALRLHGWRGEPVSRRLEALHRACSPASAGVADRLEAISSALARRRPEIERLELVDPPGDLPRAWRDALTTLEAGGTTVAPNVLTFAEARGDLQAARAPDFRPSRDGSLQLLRTFGPGDAAECVAAWIADLERRDSCLVIGGDRLLDASLRRFGLPVTGAPESPESNALLQVLPLVVALGWSPPDPGRALELVTLPAGPVPRAVAWRLASALTRQPAVDSDAWREQLAAGLDALDPSRRDRVRERLSELLSPLAPQGSEYPVDALRRRLGLLQQWLHARLGIAETDRDYWSAALAQCAAFERLVSLSGLETVSSALLHRLLAEATRTAPPPEARGAEAGLTAIGEPGGLAGPAACVVWWDFARERVPLPRRIPLSKAEAQALRDAGIELPDPSREAASIAARWRRPLLLAQQRLLLVCPERGPDGEERHPHPLWDEVVARVAPDCSPGLLAVREPLSPRPLRRRAPPLLPLPRPRKAWRVTGVVAQREVESPSSLQLLLSCPFAWAMRYAAGVRAGTAAKLPDGARLVGTVAHALLARVLAQPELSPDEAEARARALFDEQGPRMAAALFLPGADAARSEARLATQRGARALSDWLRAAGLRVVALESRVSASPGPGLLAGIPDVVVADLVDSRFAVDLKWGGARFYRTLLEDGTALQLAAYSALLSGGGPMRSGGYFIITRQRLLTTDAALVPGSAPVRGASAAETWAAVARAWTARLAELGRGELLAPGNPDPDGEVRPARDGLEDGVLSLAAPCKRCELGALCGRAFGGPR